MLQIDVPTYENLELGKRSILKSWEKRSYNNYYLDNWVLIWTN